MKEVECKRCRRIRKHEAKGLCESCYQYIWIFSNPERKKKFYSLMYEWRKKNRDKCNQYSNNWIEKYYGNYNNYYFCKGMEKLDETCNKLYSKEVADAIVFDGALLDKEMKKRGIIK